MRKQNKTAKVVAFVAKTMAKKACGAASMAGMHQAKEPKVIIK